jgi:hypothetical protein
MKFLASCWLPLCVLSVCNMMVEFSEILLLVCICMKFEAVRSGMTINAGLSYLNVLAPHGMVCSLDIVLQRRFFLL